MSDENVDEDFMNDEFANCRLHKKPILSLHKNLLQLLDSNPQMRKIKGYIYETLTLILIIG